MRITNSECRVSGSDDKYSLIKTHNKNTCDKTDNTSRKMRLASFLAWSAVGANLIVILTHAVTAAIPMPVIIVTSVVLNVIWAASAYWMVRLKWPNEKGQRGAPRSIPGFLDRKSTRLNSSHLG